MTLQCLKKYQLELSGLWNRHLHSYPTQYPQISIRKFLELIDVAVTGVCSIPFLPTNENVLSLLKKLLSNLLSTELFGSINSLVSSRHFFIAYKIKANGNVANIKKNH